MIYQYSKKRLMKLRAEVTLDNTIRKTTGELTKFGVDMVSDFSTNYSVSPLSKIIIKGAARATNSIIDFTIEVNKEKNRTRLDNLIEKEIKYVAQKANELNIAPNTIQDYDNLRKIYTKLGLTRKDFPKANQVVIEEVLKKIKNLDQSTVNLDDFESYKRERESFIKEFHKGLKKDILKFKKEIIDGHEKTIAVVNSYGQQIKLNNRAIQNQIQKNFKQDSLIALNQFKIASIEAFSSFDRASIENQINSLEEGKLDKFLSVKKKSELLDKLKSVKRTQDFINVCNHISQGGEVANKLVSLFAKGEGAEDLQKGIAAITTAANISGSIASGNYYGAAMQALGLFDSNGPSAEEQLLKQVLGKLEEIQSQLNQIEEKIDKLGEMVTNLHNDMMREFSSVHKKLDLLERQGYDNIRIALDILNKDLDYCSNIDLSNVRFLTFPNKYKGYPVPYKKCIEGLSSTLLRDFFNKNDYSESLYLHYSDRDKKNQIDKIYKPSLTYFLQQTPNDYIDKSLISLIQETNFVNDYGKNYQSVLRLEDSLFQKKLKLNGTLVKLDPKYLNKFALIQIAEYYLKLMPYYELVDANFNLFNKEEFIKEGGAPDNLEGIEKSLKTLVTVLNNSIVQQNLISGTSFLENIQSSIYTSGKSNDEKELALDLLKQNQIISQNYATFILYRELNIGKIISYTDKNNNTTFNSISRWQDFQKKINEARKGLDNTNNEIKIEDVIYNPQYQLWLNKSNLILRLIYKDINGVLNSLDIPILHVKNIENGRFIYPQEIPKLRSYREKVIEKIIEIEYFKNLKKEKPLYQNELKYIFLN
ncbi:hypothetical protein [Tenacibaculum xiamenense]|uniref:hypothetical protein n=1 Tax=Tenacibaculum xiamenense TaxID=1261553 RepID=UPI0038B592B7